MQINQKVLGLKSTLFSTVKRDLLSTAEYQQWTNLKFHAYFRGNLILLALN